MYLVQKLIIEILSLSFAIGTAILLRWLFYLSTPQNDIAWAMQKLDKIAEYLDHLKWYRGEEYLHQLRFNRIVNVTVEIVEEEESSNE